ncbi:MAG: winged helix-turn-helix transcriptional regulator [Bacteroidales bacterium]|nr:winged helix-turn-helix transcriptional regulator [Bacteroidales bacterium]
MAHPIRLFIIHQLQKQKHGVQELSNIVEIDISTMSRHLDVLKRHKIIDGEKINNNVFYTLKIPCVLEFMVCTNKVINQAK